MTGRSTQEGRRRGLRVAACVFALACLALAAACSRVGASAVSIPVGPATTASLSFAMMHGSLAVSGGGVALVEGSLPYDLPADAPVVSSHEGTAVTGPVAFASIAQPAASKAETWALVAGGGVPTDIDATLGGDARASLDLRFVDVRVARVRMSSGDASIALAGPHPSLTSLQVDGGPGSALTVDASGEYPAIATLRVAAADGPVTLDLSGAWGKSFTADVSSRGHVTITLPAKVRVDVRVPTGVRVDAPLFTAHSASNSHYGGGGGTPAGGLAPAFGIWTHLPATASPYTVAVNISGASDVTLRLVAP